MQKQKKLTLKQIDKKIARTKRSLALATGAQEQERINKLLGYWENKRKEILQDSKADKISKNFDKIKQAAAIQGKFQLPDGNVAFTPEKIVPTNRKNVFADERVQDYYPEEEELAPFVEKGDYILILKNEKPTPQAIAIPVEFNAIQSARSQRFRILDMSKKQLGKDKVLQMQLSIIKNAVEKIDKRLKKPQAIIDKYMEEFLASRSETTIASDLVFLCKIA